jgi:hypothetical protein
MNQKTLPTIDDTPTKPKAKKQAPAEVPASEGYIPRNIDLRMTRPQAKIMKDKLRALQDAGEKTADGRHVTNRSQALRWIIENLIDNN